MADFTVKYSSNKYAMSSEADPYLPANVATMRRKARLGRHSLVAQSCTLLYRRLYSASCAAVGGRRIGVASTSCKLAVQQSATLRYEVGGWLSLKRTRQ